MNYKAYLFGEVKPKIQQNGRDNTHSQRPFLSHQYNKDDRQYYHYHQYSGQQRIEAAAVTLQPPLALDRTSFPANPDELLQAKDERHDDEYGEETSQKDNQSRV